MKTSSIAVETSRSTTQSDSIVRQTNKRSSYHIHPLEFCPHFRFLLEFQNRSFPQMNFIQLPVWLFYQQKYTLNRGGVQLNYAVIH